MKPPKIKFKDKVEKEIQIIDPILTSREAITEALIVAIDLAEEITAKGLETLEDLLKDASDEEILKRWDDMKIGASFFGESCTVRQIKKVKRRIKLIHRRLSKKRLRIRLKPQGKAPSKTTYARNLGSVLTPRSFSVYPQWFKQEKNGRAETIIHELFHDSAFDHKVKIGERDLIAYGRYLALELAKENPKKARRNPDNYVEFCVKMWYRKKFV